MGGARSGLRSDADARVTRTTFGAGSLRDPALSSPADIDRPADVRTDEVYGWRAGGDVAMLSARRRHAAMSEERLVRATAPEVLRRVLSDAPGDPLCDACLSAICGLSPEETRTAIALLLKNTEEFDRRWSCASCRRSVTAVFYRAKCAHCSGRLQDGDKGFRMGEEVFHTACLRLLVTDESIRLSQDLGRRSRRLIKESRRRMRAGHDWPPLESP